MISIVTAYYNRKELFKRTLESIKLQNYQGNFEVIAVDDGSKEEERLEDLTLKYPFLKVIRLDPDKKWYQNSCIPFNIGFNAAKGDQIILQNPECFHLGNILEYTDKNLKDNIYLSFACFSLDKEVTDNLNEIIKAPERIKQNIQENDHIVTKDGDAGWYNHSTHRPEAYHFCTAITKKDLDSLGGFSELLSLGIAFDDNDFVWRVKRKGMKITFVDSEIILHQNHYSPNSTSYQNRVNKELLFEKNRKIFNNIIQKNGYQANRFLKNVPFNMKVYIIPMLIFILKLKNYLKENTKGIRKYISFIKSLMNNPVLRSQYFEPKKIPIIIINYNQLFYLKQQIDFYLKRGFKNIIVIDNQSTYPPLLEYYKEIKDKITIEYQKENAGHLVFFKSPVLQKKYSKGYYIVTDADIIPNDQLPEKFMRILINKLFKYSGRITKIGFALRLDDIPESYPLKRNVLNWESQFWQKEAEKDMFFADIDTTFALYTPNYIPDTSKRIFMNAIRMAADFTCTHGGWYLDINNLSDEQKFYINTSSNSNSWKVDEKGKLDGNYKNIY
ncbi:glycosyltransferase [Chryseobacterium antibioticum]|uniref:Glycosyltransferase n=1 Tax=Chryseobacterium pyrolae TaxID=2987481 RepID=A0ABT2II10_9FLAO|nr:glycosyltransferase [Chryseobacterium pyrolae]MCT2407872.1 glycosyltransferase [Chryseobacterium pyrolae]